MELLAGRTTGSNTTMTDPLLQGQHDESPTAWPESASMAILKTPRLYRRSSGECRVMYSSDRKMLLIVDNATEQVLDAMDPKDVIGANVEIKLYGSADALRAVEGRSQNGFSNDSKGSETNIFDPLTKDTDKIFTNKWNNNEPLSEIPRDTQASAVLSIFVYPKAEPSMLDICGVSSRGDAVSLRPTPNAQPTVLSDKHPRVFHPRRFDVAPAEDFAAVTALVKAIRKLCNIHEGEGNRQKYLILVNPVSGPKKNGAHVARTLVAPMLEQAGIDHEIVVTTHARHAEEFVAEQTGNYDIASYDGLILLGGDGIVHEALQGIYKRSDWRDLLKKIKFGIVPCGTANGLAKSLAHASKELCSQTDSVFLIVQGKTTPMDISQYVTTSRKYLSHLTFTYSIIADIDIESEKIHWMGNIRFDLWAVVRVAFLRKYPVKFSYLPLGKEIEQMPALDQPLAPEDGWITSQDNLYMFWATHVSHAGERVFHAPQKRVQEGHFHILVVRNQISRFQLARILLGLETGSHVDMRGVEWIECTAYRLEPLSNGSFNDLDGEVIESGPVQGQVVPSGLRMFCSPYYI